MTTAAPRAGTPRVSIVIPSARGGAFLREAVQSVLGQTLADFELIVVGDGCADDLRWLDGIDPRVRVVRQPRAGESVARNVGIRSARSDLVAFLDDDDRMLPERLAAQAAAMERDAGVALCHTQFRFIDAAGTPGPDGYARDVGYLDLLRGEIGVLMPTTMMRKSQLEEVGTFDAALRVGPDIDVVLRLARRYRVAFLPGVLTEYRLHDANASGDRRIAGRSLRALIAKHLSLAEQCGDTEATAAARAGMAHMRRFTSAGCIVLARRAWARHDGATTGRLLAEAFVLSPTVTARDLIGNRRVVRSILTRAHGRTEPADAPGVPAASLPIDLDTSRSGPR